MNYSGQTTEFWTFSSSVVSSKQLKKLVGTPRFELGTPCTPCKGSFSDKSLTNKEYSRLSLSRIGRIYEHISACLPRKHGIDSGRFSAAIRAAARESSGGQCMCDGLCARQHTGRCLNVEGRCATGSRYPVRLGLVDGRELCPGCCEPYRTEMTQPLREAIAAVEGELRSWRRSEVSLADPILITQVKQWAAK